MNIEYILWAAAILYTPTWLVWINNALLAVSTLTSDWEIDRNRWDILHRWRVVLLTTAFAFLIVVIKSKVPLFWHPAIWFTSARRSGSWRLVGKKRDAGKASKDDGGIS